MILSEVIVNEIDGRKLRKTTSLDGNLLHKVGTDEYYSEAYDILSANYDYEEVDENLISYREYGSEETHTLSYEEFISYLNNKIESKK